MIDSRVAKIVSAIELRSEPKIATAAYTDPLTWFASIYSQSEGDLLLDGADDTKKKGRYSVAACNPLFIVSVKDNIAKFKSGGKEIEFESTPVEVIEWLEKLLPEKAERQMEPFDGCLVFLLSYEMNRYYENLPTFKSQKPETDDLWCALYPRVRVFDSVLRKAYDVDYCERQVSVEDKLPTDRAYSLKSFECDETESDFLQKIEEIKRYIEEGDAYQVNLSRRLAARFEGNPLALYSDIRKRNPAAYGAFLAGSDSSLLSFSPELFFSLRGNSLETRPIKGTAQRAEDYGTDQRNIDLLKNSEKDRAENIMIVDLMRNDLSKICEPHSVSVPKILECETLPTLHHLVSTISGKLKAGKKLSDILQACYPGGSITGAPKIRAMEIIAELETSPRGHYCGSLIACGLNGSITASILIRTLTLKGGEAVYRTGGGITTCSDPKKEFEETVHKAAMLESLVQKPTLSHV